jgi:hypothetical protein
MPMKARRRSTLLRLAPIGLTTLLTFASGLSPSAAETPTEANFRACNAEAEAAVKSGTPAPTTKDHARAEAERKGGSGPGTSARDRVEDPQLRGMARDRADEPEYQAAYRTCMRRSGF